ncbi:hypothetical protein SDRG_03686 [Saprolegnia diclina VS20]|uniref:Uncharacterized protein n=1 Tax=Saprolegnia diclina (strain VS20) TaxID=1156394 RepID=T0QVL3_SAPDV|nr:hypothetical protein SDRG_03686 [Saprolegnia diclina VS20]EQC38721.1 hypothetical protein SDRG_03686 [Saprolegnia diclina VS20]|eukprot:XP_008607545.1 hypothetical protein SDRG_03686 [Saprolegnia diclina VS20]
MSRCFVLGCDLPPTDATSQKCEKHKHRAKCQGDPLCYNQVYARGRCVRHGGKKPCLYHGCTGNARRNDMCHRHGGARHRLCSEPGCDKIVSERRKCSRHGDTALCHFPRCLLKARLQGYCGTHYRYKAQHIEPTAWNVVDVAMRNDAPLAEVESQILSSLLDDCAIDETSFHVLHVTRSESVHMPAVDLRDHKTPPRRP